MATRKYINDSTPKELRNNTEVIQEFRAIIKAMNKTLSSEENRYRHTFSWDKTEYNLAKQLGSLLDSRLHGTRYGVSSIFDYISKFNIPLTPKVYEDIQGYLSKKTLVECIEAVRKLVLKSSVYKPYAKDLQPYINYLLPKVYPDKFCVPVLTTDNGNYLSIVAHMYSRRYSTACPSELWGIHIGNPKEPYLTGQEEHLIRLMQSYRGCTSPIILTKEN